MTATATPAAPPKAIGTIPRGLLVLVGVSALIAVLATFSKGLGLASYHLVLISTVLFWATQATSWNLLSGFAGYFEPALALDEHPQAGPHDDMVVDEHHAPRRPQDLPRALHIDLGPEDRVHRQGVARHHRDAHAGGRDLQIGQSQDLAGLVAYLEFLAGPAGVAQRPGPRHDVERQRRGERAEVVTDHLA